MNQVILISALPIILWLVRNRLFNSWQAKYAASMLICGTLFGVAVGLRLSQGPGAKVPPTLTQVEIGVLILSSGFAFGFGFDIVRTFWRKARAKRQAALISHQMSLEADVGQILWHFDQCLASNDPSNLTLGTAIERLETGFLFQVDVRSIPTKFDLDEFNDALNELEAGYPIEVNFEMAVCHEEFVWTLPSILYELVHAIPREETPAMLRKFGFKRGWGEAKEAHTVEFWIPPGATGQSAIANAICAMAEFPVLIEIVDDGMWNDYASRDVVRLILLTEQVSSARFCEPAVVVDAADRAFAHAYLAALLHCQWDVRLLESEASRVWEFSHDEWCAVESPNPAKLAEVRELMAAFKLPSTDQDSGGQL